MTTNGNILIFDSGVGGLSVANAVRQIMPLASVNFIADNAAFPYGAWDETALVKRINLVIEKALAATNPDVVIIACNTASTIALETLRLGFNVPFVGTVPAIKPAAQRTLSGMIAVLATPGTVEREYTESLIHTYAFHCDVKLHGAVNLAQMAERYLHGGSVSHEELAAEIAPAFVQKQGKKTDMVVLGCTHYPLLMKELEVCAPWPVEFIDPAPAIARRAREVLDAPRPEGTAMDCGNMVYFTAGGAGLDSHKQVFARFGFENSKILNLPV